MTEDAKGNWRYCECGKRGYTSKEQARHATGKIGARVRIYKCGRSGFWHATAGEKR